jgi:iron complex transport system substrate-binding protein
MSAPQRIVSLLASATEILYGLGLGDRIVGVSHECDFPIEARSKPRLTCSHIAAVQTSLQIDQQVKDFAASGQSLYEIDERLISELAPDLIVTQSQCDVCAIKYADVMKLVNSHESLRQTQVVALSPNTLDDVFADILRVGRATSRVASAEAYLGQLVQRVQRVKQSTADLSRSQRPRVVCVEWVDPLMIAANWTPELVAFAGGQNGLSQAGRHSETFKWGEVVAYDPEVLVLIPCGFDLARTLQEVACLPDYDGWQSLSAVRHERVFAIDGNAYFNRSGPRLVDSLEILAHLFHPTMFGAPALIPEPTQAWSTFSA